MDVYVEYCIAQSGTHSNSQRINKINKKEIWDKRGKLFGPKRLHACVSVAATLVGFPTGTYGCQRHRLDYPVS